MKSIKRKAYFIIGFFYFVTFLTYGQNGQNQTLADSLINLYNSGYFLDDDLDVLAKIAEAETNPDKSLKYADLLIISASKDSVLKYLHKGFLQRGNALQFKGNNVDALDSYLKSLNYANRDKNESGIGSLMISIAGTYTAMENSRNAQIYYKKGIKQLRKSNDSVKIATALLNAGDDHFIAGKLDSALIYTKESEVIFKKQNYPIGQAYSLGNMGMILAEQEKDNLAETQINEAISILEKLEDYYPITVYLTYMSDIYLRKKDFSSALGYANRSLELAQNYGLKKQISDSNLKLSELHETKGDQITAYKFYKEHIVYRDSVINLKNVQEAADTRTNFEVAQKQSEIDLSEERRKNQRIVVIATAIALFLIALLAFLLFRRNKFINRTKEIIEKERDRSDTLLLNILPEETANELKETGAVKAKKYESATVLFTDFKGFTTYSEKLSPEALVETVSFYFSKFDAIIEKHGLEKIKTIGDAYMAAGGLHDNTKDHAERMIKAAFEIADFVEKTKKDDSATEMTFDIRIGINTGPVVAGVVGTKKFAYDIWGDTVNVASRMESMSEPGKVNISENTYAFVKDKFTCEYRGEIDVKNRGKMKMYFVNA